MNDFADIVERLCRISDDASGDPCAGCDWPERIGPDEWCMSPELLSLHGTELYEALDERGRRRLSFAEAVNFFSLNIHGERLLVAGIAQRLYRGGCEPVSRYLHHFLAEENRHMALFAQFCRRYAGKIYGEKKFALPRGYAPGEEDFLFFAKVLVFEEIVDRYNVVMAQDRRLAPVARHINRTHHRDETRHLAFGRRLVVELFERHAPRWSAGELAAARADLAAYFAACWGEYYNPDAYRDAGLADPYGARVRLLEHGARRRHHEAFSRGVIDHLRRHGILAEEPRL
jgi:hypothetical protein